MFGLPPVARRYHRKSHWLNQLLPHWDSLFVIGLPGNETTMEKLRRWFVRLLFVVHDRTCCRHDVWVDELFELKLRHFHKRGFPRKIRCCCCFLLITIVDGVLRMFVTVCHWILMNQHRIDFHENVTYVRLIEIYLRSPEIHRIIRSKRPSVLLLDNVNVVEVER